MNIAPISQIRGSDSGAVGFLVPLRGERQRAVAQSPAIESATPRSESTVQPDSPAEQPTSAPKPAAPPAITACATLTLTTEQVSRLRSVALAVAIRRLVGHVGNEVVMWLFTLACLLAGLSPTRAAEQAPTKEYQVKAAFLYNFTKFVDWPAESFSNASNPIVIGVFGQNPVGSELESLVKDRKVNGREILVRPVAGFEEAKAVHVLFIGFTEDKQVCATLKALQGQSVLTVGETDPFADNGGMIRFLLEGDKVRFEINSSAAARAKLHISAQLQKLATRVRKAP